MLGRSSLAVGLLVILIAGCVSPAASHLKPTSVASIPDLMLGSRCEFTQDGKFLLVASYGGVTPGLPLGMPQGDLLANGVSVYDISDVKSPKFLQHSTVGIPQGDTAASSAYHNVGTALINGTNYIFQTYTGNILALSPDGKTMKVVAHVDHSDHDVWVGKHPVTGDWFL